MDITTIETYRGHRIVLGRSPHYRASYYRIADIPHAVYPTVADAKRRIDLETTNN